MLRGGGRCEKVYQTTTLVLAIKKKNKDLNMKNENLEWKLETASIRA